MEGDEAKQGAVEALNWLLLAVKSERLTLPQLISDHLGTALTNPDELHRARAVELLASVLQRLPGLALQPAVLLPRLSLGPGFAAEPFTGA